MTPTQQRILDTMARHQAELEDLVDDHRQKYTDRVREILTDPTERDPFTWHDALASLTDDTEWVLQAVAAPISAFSDDENDLYALATVVRAAEVQAFVEIFAGEIVRIGAKREEVLGDAAGLSKAQLVEVGKAGVTKANVAANRRPNDDA